MRNILAFIAGAIFSLWFSLATYNFATQTLPSQGSITLTLPIPMLPEIPSVPRLAHVYTQAEYDCLHENIFFEARNQSPLGMAMVGIVTIERTKLPEFPKTICGVVHESNQFSWTAHKPKINHKNKIEEDAWVFTGLVAQNLLINSDGVDEQYRNIVYYHATRIKQPYWARNLIKTFVIGEHVFYSKESNETSSFVLR